MNDFRIKDMAKKLTAVICPFAEKDVENRAEFERSIVFCLYEYWSDKIADVWTVEDVLEDHPNFTHDEAGEILGIVLDNIDANVGVNWEVIEETVEQYRKDNGKESPNDEDEDDDEDEDEDDDEDEDEDKNEDDNGDDVK